MDGIFNNELPIWMNIINWGTILLSALLVFSFTKSGFVDDEPFSKIYTEEDSFEEFDEDKLVGVLWVMFFSLIAGFCIASLPNIFYSADYPKFGWGGFYVLIQRTVLIFIGAFYLFYKEYLKWKISHR